jgi:putative ABC transport system permease protein
MNGFALGLRLARRELRGGLKGFRIFFACLVLGVAAIAGVGSLSEAMLTGLAEQGRTLLGGDVSVNLVHRTANTNERAFLARYGRVSETTTMRAMAYAVKDRGEGQRTLVELKAVDGAYPLYGAVGLAPMRDLRAALACKNGICGAVAERTLLDRLRLRPGGTLRIGTQTFRVAAVLTGEPDRISGGFSLGPHVLVSEAALKRTGLVTIGSLINYHYRVALAGGETPAAFKTAATAHFPDAGWQIRDRNDAAPGLRRFVEQVTMFLTLVGLTALAIGGIGAGQAIGALLDRKRAEIATLKALGAEGALVFCIYFFQVMAIALVAVVAGLIVGAALPFAIGWLYGAVLPAPTAFAVYPAPLVLAAVFGLFSAAAFAIPPLARAREIAPASLFRDIVAPARGRGRLPYLGAAAACAAVVIALALFVAPTPLFAVWFLAGIAGGLALLRATAAALRFGLARLPRPHRPGLRLALANLTRPGAATAGVVVALGLGLTLLASVSLLNHTIAARVVDSLPGKAPSFFFIDIQPGEAKAFDATIARFPAATAYKRTPMIRGRITALNGVPARDAHVEPGARWALSGDRGITYARAMPKDTIVTEGRWWPPDYKGPTRISFDAALARAMHLKLGDTITLNVLGRELTGRIANLRKVDFSNGRQNFILVLSPGIIDHAPHSFLATVRVPPNEEAAVYRAVTDAFPNVSTVRVKDAIAEVNGLLQKLNDGVRAASLLTILAGLLVLAGAIAAGQRARLYDSTVLKVLGATRARIAGVYALEYGLIGIVTGVIALGAGTLAASTIASQVFELPFAFDARIALITVGGGGTAALAFGLVAAWAALAAKPAALLRNP